MKIFIVILHYGKLETTQGCIASLAKYSRSFQQIVLINNDENITLFPSQFKKINKKLHIINNEKNLGFAAGVNVGIRYALSQKAEYIFLLNNDTIVEKDFLKKLVHVLKKEKTSGIVGPAIWFRKDGKILYDLGGRVNMFFGRTSHDEVEKITDVHQRLVQYISGCCMLIKNRVFEKVGLFDERFFLYYEDVDFCLRAKQAGFLSHVLPSVTIYHELSKAAGKVSTIAVYHQTKSGVLFGKKYCKVKIANLLFLFAQSILFVFKNPHIGIYAFRGLIDGLMSSTVKSEIK